MDKVKVFELTESYSYFNKKAQKTVRSNTFFEPASYSKYDAKMNDTVEIRYAETANAYEKDGKTGTKYFPHKIKFAKGLLVVKPTQPDLYEFLLNSPSNEANGGKKFRLKDPVMAATKSVENRKRLFEAQELIFNTLSEKDKRRILLSSNYQDANEIDVEIVDEELLKIAEKDPAAFIKMAASKKLDAKGSVVMGIKKGFLKVDEDKQIWSWGANAGASGNIVTVPRGQSLGDWFAEWMLSTDNSGVLNHLNNLLNGKAPKENTAEPKAPAKAAAGKAPKE